MHSQETKPEPNLHRPRTRSQSPFRPRDFPRIESRWQRHLPLPRPESHRSESLRPVRKGDRHDQRRDGTGPSPIPSVPPGVHEYQFSVDGLRTIDSQNSWIKPQRWPSTSILHVPSNPPAPWDLQDIPHGTLHTHDYKSKALDNKWRRLVVYTPPGEPTAPLPVLYLSHGFSDNDGSWSVHGKAHWILDSLIAQKKAVPMIIVMPDAHPLPPGPGYADDYSRLNTEAFCKELVTDMIPLIEGNYKASPKPEHRAFAGLSMGGHHALTVALTQYNTFNWIGAFSSAPPPAAMISDGLGSPTKSTAPSNSSGSAAERTTSSSSETTSSTRS